MWGVRKILGCVRFENGGSLNIFRIGNGISYIGFNQSRHEDIQQGGVFFVYCLISHNLITQINLGLISCYGN